MILSNAMMSLDHGQIYCAKHLLKSRLVRLASAYGGQGFSFECPGCPRGYYEKRNWKIYHPFNVSVKNRCPRRPMKANVSIPNTLTLPNPKMHVIRHWGCNQQPDYEVWHSPSLMSAKLHLKYCTLKTSGMRTKWFRWTDWIKERRT